MILHWSFSIPALASVRVPLIVHTRVYSLHVDLFHLSVILEFLFGQVYSCVDGVVLAGGSALFWSSLIVTALFGRCSVVVIIQIVIVWSFHHFVHDDVVPVLFWDFLVEWVHFWVLFLWWLVLVAKYLLWLVLFHYCAWLGGWFVHVGALLACWKWACGVSVTNIGTGDTVRIVISGLIVDDRTF